MTPTVFAGAAKLALVVMLMGSIGLHWALLQTVAWAGMIVTYTHESSSLTTALERTFDGKHPCKICVVVEEGKKAEKHSDQLFFRRHDQTHRRCQGSPAGRRRDRFHGRALSHPRVGRNSGDRWPRPPPLEPGYRKPTA